MMFKPAKLDHERVKIMGDAMMQARPGVTAACCVDADDGGKYQGKADWYVEQFRRLYPLILVGRRFDGPTPGAHTIMLVAPPIRRRGCSSN